MPDEQGWLHARRRQDSGRNVLLVRYSAWMRIPADACTSTPTNPMHPLEPQTDPTWLLHATNRIVRCRDVVTLLDLAYEAIRTGLGFDRVGLVLVDHEQDRLVEHIGTHLTGRKVYPCDHSWPLDDSARRLFGLDDARLQADGPGFIYLTGATREEGPNAAQCSDGCPGQ